MKNMWAAKTRDGKPYGKAHYLDEKGRPSCHQLLAPFTCDWSPLTDDSQHHLCGMCRRVASRECRCQECGVRERSRP